MSAKNIVVLFTGAPLGDNRLGEKLRMSLGLTLNDDNALKLVFMGKARHALEKLDEKAAHMQPVNKHVSMLARLGAKFYVESGGGFNYLPEVKAETVGGADAAALIRQADALIH